MSHMGQQNLRFGPVSALLLRFEFTDGFEMMHKVYDFAWYCYI